jgi:hypothetical protein
VSENATGFRLHCPDGLQSQPMIQTDVKSSSLRTRQWSASTSRPLRSLISYIEWFAGARDFLHHLSEVALCIVAEIESSVSVYPGTRITIC